MQIQEALESVYTKYQKELGGQVSNAIPALHTVDPDLFGISITTVDGRQYDIGDADEKFTIQSISKAFSYGLALEQHGTQFVETKVGVEPTGEDFDSIIKIDDDGRPYNPMVNSGAIVTSSLLLAGRSKNRFDQLLSFYSKFASRKLSLNEDVFSSEINTSDKNWAIAHLLKHFGALSKTFRSDLELYFQQCSVDVSAKDLAVMGATLANKGINPISNELCIGPENLRSVLSVILTCGMYNYSGEWVFDVGIPAKSGISGGILMVVPGVMGITVYSPRLDKRGNSVRGIKVSEDLSQLLGLHMFDPTTPPKS